MMTTKDNPRGITLTRLAREGVDFDPLLSAEEVRAILGLLPRHFEMMVKAGTVPAPLRFGNLRRWRSSDINILVGVQAPKDRSAAA